MSFQLEACMQVFEREALGFSPKVLRILAHSTAISWARGLGQRWSVSDGC
jgi:hypothetical protein